MADAGTITRAACVVSLRHIVLCHCGTLYYVTATHCVVSLRHIVLCHCDTLCCVTATHCVVSLCLFCGAQQRTGNQHHNWLGRLAQNRLFHGMVVCLLSGVNSMQILLEICDKPTISTFMCRHLKSSVKESNMAFHHP